MFLSKIINFFKKSKPKFEPQDKFDKEFGFILKYKIDTKENYKIVKAHFFNRSLKTSL